MLSAHAYVLSITNHVQLFWQQEPNVSATFKTSETTFPIILGLYISHKCCMSWYSLLAATMEVYLWRMQTIKYRQECFYENYLYYRSRSSGQTRLSTRAQDSATEGSWVRTLAEPLRNFGRAVYPALPVTFGGDNKSHWLLVLLWSTSALVRQINKNFKLIFLSIFLLHHTGDVNRIHILFEFWL